MPVTYNDTLRSARMDEVIDAIDANASPANLVITDSSNNVLVTIALAKPSFQEGTPTAGVITMLDVPRSGDATADGTAALARIADGGGTAVVTGLTVSATGAGGEIQLNSTSISTGQTVTLNSGQITHA